MRSTRSRRPSRRPCACGPRRAAMWSSSCGSPTSRPCVTRSSGCALRDRGRATLADQAVAQADCDGLRPMGGVEFGQDVGDVGLDRFAPEHQALSDLAVGAAVGQQLENLLLTRRSARADAAADPGGRGRRVDARIGILASPRTTAAIAAVIWSAPRPARWPRPHHGRGQCGTSSSLSRSTNMHDPDIGMGGADPAGGLEAVETRQRCVHNTTSGRRRATSSSASSPSAASPTMTSRPGLGQDATKPFAHDGVIVDKQHAGAPPSGSGRPSSGEGAVARVVHAASEVTSAKRGVKWAILDSNQGPHPYQRCALTD